MLDGVSLKINKKRTCSAVAFFKNKGLELIAEVGLVSGVINPYFLSQNKAANKYRVKLGYYNLTVIEHISEENPKEYDQTIIIRGSLQKNNFDGTNYQDFHINNCKEEILWFCNYFDAQPVDVTVHSLEIGINAELPFDAKWFQPCLLLYGTTPFQEFRSTRKRSMGGLRADCSQYTMKWYPKPNPTNASLFRFEKAHHKMQALAGYNIKTLADLISVEKFTSLKDIPPKSWDKVLLYNPTINISSLSITAGQKQLLRDGMNRDFWLRTYRHNRRTFNNKRTAFRELTAEHSATDLHATIRQLIVEKVSNLLQPSTGLPLATQRYNNAKSDTLTTWMTGKPVSMTKYISTTNESIDPYDSIPKEPVLPISHSPPLTIDHHADTPARLKANRFIHRLKNYFKKSKIKYNHEQRSSKNACKEYRQETT